MPSRTATTVMAFAGCTMLAAAVFGRTKGSRTEQSTRERFDRTELIAELFRRLKDTTLQEGGSVLHETFDTVSVMDKDKRYRTEIKLSGSSAHTIDGYIRLFNRRDQCVHDQRVDMDVLAHMLGDPSTVYGSIGRKA